MSQHTDTPVLEDAREMLAKAMKRRDPKAIRYWRSQMRKAGAARAKKHRPAMKAAAKRRSAADAKHGITKTDREKESAASHRDLKRRMGIESVVAQIADLSEALGLRFTDLEYDDVPAGPKKAVGVSGRFADLDIDNLPTKAIKQAIKKVKVAADPPKKAEKKKRMVSLGNIVKRLKVRPHKTDPTLITIKLQGTNAAAQKDLQAVLKNYYGFTGDIPMLTGGKYTMAFVPKQAWEKANVT
jgi:hypothetical protein